MSTLDYKREMLAQFLVMGSIFGAFSVGGAIALLTVGARTRVLSAVFVALCVTSLLFIFATTLIAILIPGTRLLGSGATRADLERVYLLADVGYWGIILGIVALFVSVSMFGFVYSRRIGAAVLITASGLFALLLLCMWGLAGALP